MKTIKNEKGYTLVLTLIITVLVIMFSTTFAAKALNQNKLVENTDDTYEVTALAEMGVEYYKAKILNLFSVAFDEAKAVKNSNHTAAQKEAQITAIYNSLKADILNVRSGKTILDGTHEYDLIEIKFDATNPNKLLYTVAGKKETKEKNIETHIIFPSLENLIAHNTLKEYLLVLSNDPTYLAKVAEHQSALTKYNEDLAKYDEAQIKYQQYLIDKAKYDEDLKNYNEAIKTIKIPFSDTETKSSLNVPDKTNLDGKKLNIRGDAYFGDLQGNSKDNKIFIAGNATFNNTGGGIQTSIILIAGDVTFTGKATAGIKDSTTFCVAGNRYYDSTLKNNDINKLSQNILTWGPGSNEDTCGSYTNTINPPVKPTEPPTVTAPTNPGLPPEPPTVTITEEPKDLDDVLVDNVIYK